MDFIPPATAAQYAIWLFALSIGLSAGAAGDDDRLPPPAGAAALSLDETAEIARRRQPLLEAQSAQIEAAEHRSVAAAQLPDPQLSFGVSELPVTTSDAWSLTRDGDTDLMIGLMQEFPRAEKRRLRAEREVGQASVGRAGLADLERAVVRDAGLAYLEALYPEQAMALTQALEREVVRERAAAEIALRASRIRQSEILAVDVELELVRDRLAALWQRSEVARAKLSRWIGLAAQRPLQYELPVLPEPPTAEALLMAMHGHPHLRGEDEMVQVAVTELRLTEQDYKPDWRLEMRFGYRPEYSEMLTLMASVDLPFFTENRQDRRTQAAVADVAAAEARRADAMRRHEAEVLAAYREWNSLGERLRRYDEALLPRARARTDAALAAYRSGAADIDDLFDARRRLLEIELMRLEVAVDRLRRRLEIEYFATEDRS